MKTVTKRINEIKRGEYGEWVGGKPCSAEPTREEIADAIAQREPERRGFQQHKEELGVEFYSQGEGKCIRLAKQYHAGRAGFFVVNGWENDPIKICVHNVLEDGGHRLLAAQHLGMETLDCVIVNCNKCLNN